MHSLFILLTVTSPRSPVTPTLPRGGRHTPGLWRTSSCPREWADWGFPVALLPGRSLQSDQSAGWRSVQATAYQSHSSQGSAMSGPTGWVSTWRNQKPIRYGVYQRGQKAGWMLVMPAFAGRKSYRKIEIIPDRACPPSRHRFLGCWVWNKPS